MGAERETRQGANVLYSGGDRLHSAQGEADFGNPNTPPHLDQCQAQGVVTSL